METNFVEGKAPAQVEWSEAVKVTERTVRNWIDFMSDYPDVYSPEDIEHVETAWLRVLRG